VERERASGEQVRAFPTQASGARSRQHESLAPFHHEPLDLVEHLGNALHLVDDDPVGVPWRDEFAQAVGVREQFRVQRRVQEIEVQGVGKPLSQPCGLSCSPGTEQEEALAQGERAVQQSGIHDSILHKR